MRLLCLTTLMFLIVASSEGKKIFCYYSSFAHTRHGLGKFLPEDIDPHLCTHIIFAFVDITPDGLDLRPFSGSDPGPGGLYARTLALKEKNPALKVLLAVGGWVIGSKPFLPMIHTEESRKTWIQNVVRYVRKHGFDGFDVDWEFPATRGSPPQDKYRFTKLMKGLYEAFRRESVETGREKLLLTLATASGTYYIDKSYEPHKIIHFLDYMLLMTYNYHGQWEKKTGHHSGLNRHMNDPTTGEKSQLYQQWSIDYWLNVGIPKDKLIVGIPTYGMSFTLADPGQHGVHAPVTGGGRLGDYTRETGILSTYEVCLNLQKKGWHSEWIEEQAVPFAYGGDQWVGYENKKSIVLKAQNINSRNLAGAFVWSVEMDDFRGVCGQGNYPLISTIHNIIGDESGIRASSRLASSVLHSAHDLKMTETLKYKNPAKIHQVAQQKLEDRRLKKFRQFHARHELQNAAAAMPERITASPDALMTSPAPATSQPQTDDSNGRLHVEWWGGGRHNRWRPWSKMLSKRHRHYLKRPRSPWRAAKSETASSMRSLAANREPAFRQASANARKAKLYRPKLSPTTKVPETTSNPNWYNANSVRTPATTAGPMAVSTSFRNWYSTNIEKTSLPMTEPTVPIKNWYVQDIEKTPAASPTRPPVPVKTWLNERSEETSDRTSKPPALNTPNQGWYRKNTEMVPTTTARPVAVSTLLQGWYGKNNEIPKAATTRPPAKSSPIKSWYGKYNGRSSAMKTAPPSHIHTHPRTTLPPANAPASMSRTDVCRQNGVGTFPDPLSCQHFVICMPGDWQGYDPHIMACPAGTRFDADLKICNYASHVLCFH